MKKWFLISAATLLVLLTGLAMFSELFRTKVDALGDVGGTLVAAGGNQWPVIECGGVVLKAKHNIDVVVRAADYLEAVGCNTQVFMEIARIAGSADAECPRMAAVLDLAVMKQSESMRVLALARTACHLKTEEQVAVWQSEFDALVATAEYASVEAGLARQVGD